MVAQAPAVTPEYILALFLITAATCIALHFLKSISSHILTFMQIACLLTFALFLGGLLWDYYALTVESVPFLRVLYQFKDDSLLSPLLNRVFVAKAE